MANRTGRGTYSSNRSQGTSLTAVVEMKSMESQDVIQVDDMMLFFNLQSSNPSIRTLA